MTEAEAQSLVEGIVGDVATDRLAALVALVVEENERQNLIARSTVPAIWSRHVLDSVQLIPLADPDGRWIDIGTGGGFPGLAVAMVRSGPTMIVEPRKQRADFLRNAANALGASRVDVADTKIERVRSTGDVISARAVGSIASIFDMAHHCASPATRWLLHRGAGWQDDCEHATPDWKGVFHVEQSLTDPAARIVVATQVSRR